LDGQVHLWGTRMYKIITADIGHIPDMIPAAKKFVEFYGMSWDEGSVQDLLYNLVTNGVVLLAEQENKIVGGIGGIVSTNPWNQNIKMLCEMFWWVDEDCRGGMLGIKLLKAFENSFNGPVVMSTLPQTPIKPDLLLKLGYKAKENVFVKE